MNVLILISFVVIVIVSVQGKDFVVGLSSGGFLVSTERIIMTKIPLIRREKEYVYTDNMKRKLQAIIARDLALSDAEVSIVEGGLGATNVTLRLKGERGEGLNYVIIIFAKPTPTSVTNVPSRVHRATKAPPVASTPSDGMIVFNSAMKRKFPLNLLYYVMTL